MTGIDAPPPPPPPDPPDHPQAARQIEDSIAKLPASDTVKADSQAYSDRFDGQHPAADGAGERPEPGRASAPAGDAPAADTRSPMDRWEDSEDRIMARDIVANRQEIDILRQQGNEEAARQIEDFIAKLPASDAVKADPQAYLDRADGQHPAAGAAAERPEPERDQSPTTAETNRPDAAPDNGPIMVVHNPDDLPPDIRQQLDESDINAMNWDDGVGLYNHVMSGGESFDKFSHFDWNDTGSTAERAERALSSEEFGQIKWARPEGSGEDAVFDVIHDILHTPEGKQMTDDEIEKLAEALVSSDPHESLALARKFDMDPGRWEARNARYTLTFEGGARAAYLRSTAAPQLDDLEDPASPRRLPGGGEQVRFLNYDVGRSNLTVAPVGGRVLLEGQLEWRYRDRNP